MKTFKKAYVSWVARWGKIPVALTLTLTLLLSIVAVAIAAEYVVTLSDPDHMINGAWFMQFTPEDATGTGLFNSFLRISANKEVVQGYNTDNRPLQFDEDQAWTDSIPLSDVPYNIHEGVLYREFQLDINQTNNEPLISLDEVQIWLGGADADNISGFVPGATETDFGSFPGYTLHEVYNLDADEDNYLVLDYSYAAGSGKRDLKLLVPDSFFGDYSDACKFMGTGCEEFVVFYTEFGINDPNNDGFEEWGVEIYNVVEGFKWHDWNADGIWDASEPGLEDWRICAQQVEGGVDVGEPICMFTEADGSYTLPMPDGSYRIYETCPEAVSPWYQSYPTPTDGCGTGYHMVTVSKGDLVGGLNFGNYQGIPDIDIDKTGDDLSKVGDIVNYTITVDNTSTEGTPDLSCNITDPMLGIDENVTLAWDAMNYVIEKSYTVQQGDPDPLLNTASVSCTFVGDATEQASDSDGHSVNLFQPSIDLTKTGDDLSKIGDLVDYTITLDNTSSDDTPDLACRITDSMLGVDESFTMAWDAVDKVITVTDFEIPSDAKDPFINTAEVLCSPAGFPNELKDEAKWETNLFQPSFTFTKDAAEDYSKAGDIVNYTITFDNTSSADTPDMACTITDSMLGVDETFTAAWDAPDKVITKTYTVMVGDPDPLKNTAFISCSPMGFPNIYEDEASDSVDLLHPDFMLTKECKAEPVIAGRDAEFTVVFANTGDVDLEVYFDEALTGDGCPGTAGSTVTVPFGKSLTCAVTKTADTDPSESYVENTINAHVTLPAMYSLDNFWDPMASDTCDIYAVKKGTKWDDKNMDGIWDMEEPVLSGWKIHFFEWMGDVYAPPKEVLTGANGSYSFNVVKPGVTYAVCEVLEAGYLQTYPNVEMPAEGFVDCTQFGSEYGPIGYEIMLASGVYEVDNDFGNFKPLGCTYTQGYWKTHSTYGPAGPYDPTWDLKDGGDAIFLNPMWDTGFTWYSIMWEPPAGGNAYIILAHQYVAAWLNTHNVDPEKMADGSVLGTALADAEALLGSYMPGDVLEPAVREEFIMLAEMLDDFNEGYLGVPHCED